MQDQAEDQQIDLGGRQLEQSSTDRSFRKYIRRNLVKKKKHPRSEEDNFIMRQTRHGKYRGTQLFGCFVVIF